MNTIIFKRECRSVGGRSVRFSPSFLIVLLFMLFCSVRVWSYDFMWDSDKYV